MTIEVNGKTLETDEEGYLANLNDWEKEVASVMAEAEDLELGADRKMDPLNGLICVKLYVPRFDAHTLCWL